MSTLRENRLLANQKSWIVTFLAVVLIIQTGCGSAQTVDSLDYTIAEIKTSLVSYFRGKLAQQVGESRELMSEPFRPRMVVGRVEPPNPDDLARSYAAIRVVGNEKPYSLEVNVFMQKRSGKEGEWITDGENPRLAKELSEALVEYLQRNRNKNMIDHFRAF